MSKDFEHLGSVKDGKLSFADPISWAMALAKLNSKPVKVIIKQCFPNRTVKQNSAWWGIVIPIYMQCMGHLNDKFAHYELVTLIKPLVKIDIKGREHVGPTPTHDLDTKQSMELYKLAQDFIATEYGVDVPDPDPNWKGFSA